MPDVEAIGSGGKTVRLRGLLEDRPLLLIFVRCTYCTGCMAYAKHLAEWTEKLKDANLTVVLCLTESWKAVHKWAEEDKMPMTVLADDSRLMSKAFGVYKALGFDSFRQARPSAFLFDATGMIKWASIFPPDETKEPKLDDYLSLVAKHFGALPAAATTAATA